MEETNLVQYKSLGLVFYLDGYGNKNAVAVSDADLSKVKQEVNVAKLPLLELGGRTIASRNILEVRPSEQCRPKEVFYYSLLEGQKEVIDFWIKKDDMKETFYSRFLSMTDEQAIQRMQLWLERGKNLSKN